MWAVVFYVVLHRDVVPKTILGGSTSAMCIHFLPKLLHDVTFDRRSHALSNPVWSFVTRKTYTWWWSLTMYSLAGCPLLLQRPRNDWATMSGLVTIVQQTPSLWTSLTSRLIWDNTKIGTHEICQISHEISWISGETHQISWNSADFGGQAFFAPV